MDSMSFDSPLRGQQADGRRQLVLFVDKRTPERETRGHEWPWGDTFIEFLKISVHIHTAYRDTQNIHGLKAETHMNTHGSRYLT